MGGRKSVDLATARKRALILESDLHRLLVRAEWHRLRSRGTWTHEAARLAGRARVLLPAVGSLLGLLTRRDKSRKRSIWLKGIQTGARLSAPIAFVWRRLRRDPATKDDRPMPKALPAP